jgi:hypothetical protein
MGPTRPEEIEQAASTYQAHWTYDDRRLPNAVKEIIERTLSGGYTQVERLRDDLHAVFVQLAGQT